ncbi:2-dehydropantoate 2-reductase [Mariprofundus micogutta]|uniref:2-dehydropantoate 2-reductase n=1 Tax=Mariprofundus micogutta TaxID=1921010 RepID=A0A1L8CM58_9PROT|nr:2-dehydropantoate 2-reductase [Mariprofundus micogutta]GAV19997.1 2-dehydropantoate 2-reductase [Mariprofundus micogutta]
MRIGFAGAGAVGCHYGSKLKQAGDDVVLLARGAHLQVIQKQGLQHESEGRQKVLQIEASDDVHALSSCKVIVISCKMTGLPAMLETLKPVVKPDMLLVTMQNGVEAPDLVSTAFPGVAVVAGTAFIGARVERPGFVIHSAAGGIRLGIWREGLGAQLLPLLLERFNAADVPARKDDDAAAMLWRKLLWNCGFNAMTAITRRFAKDIAASDDTLLYIRRAMLEAVDVALALDVSIDASDIDKHVEVTLAMGPVKTSMWQDIEAGHKTEVDFINGYVVRMGNEQGIDTQTNHMLTTFIHAIEMA